MHPDTARAVVSTQRSNSSCPCAGFASVTSRPQTPVSLTWKELDLTTLRKRDVVRKGTVGSDGTYRICGLPGDVDGNVQAEF